MTWNPKDLRADTSNIATRDDVIELGSRVQCSRALLKTGAGFIGVGIVVDVVGSIFVVAHGFRNGEIARFVRGNLIVDGKLELE